MPNPLPALEAPIEAALVDSIRRFGVLVPILRDQHGNVVDGNHRVRIAREVGVKPPVEHVVHLPDDPTERAEALLAINDARRPRLSTDDRRRVVADLREQGHSLRAIGGAVGVSAKTVHQDLDSSGVTQVTPEVIGLDGKRYPATRPAASGGDTGLTLRVAEPDPVQRAIIEQTRENHGEEKARESAEAMGVAYPEPEPHRLAPMLSSNNDVWSTPQDFFDDLNAEFGFETDVCATAENTKCAAFYDENVDGLAQPWTGVCWMNPPYSEISKWIAKASLSADGGATVVALVPARTDTGWWWDYCRYAEIRFLRGRLKFGGSPNSAPFPSAVVVFGRPAGVVWWEPTKEANRDAA